ncbi:hypothetical protein ACFE04_028044 [Oxalis oulophora]
MGPCNGMDLIVAIDVRAGIPRVVQSMGQMRGLRSDTRAWHGESGGTTRINESVRPSVSGMSGTSDVNGVIDASGVINTSRARAHHDASVRLMRLMRGRWLMQGKCGLDSYTHFPLLQNDEGEPLSIFASSQGESSIIHKF